MFVLGFCVHMLLISLHSVSLVRFAVFTHGITAYFHLNVPSAFAGLASRMSLRAQMTQKTTANLKAWREQNVLVYTNMDWSRKNNDIASGMQNG